MLHCHLFFAILCCFTCWCVLEHGSRGCALLHHAHRVQTLCCRPAHRPAAPGPADRDKVSGLGAGHTTCPRCPRSCCWHPVPCSARLPAGTALGSPVAARHSRAGSSTPGLLMPVLLRLCRGYFSNVSRESCFLFRNPVANSLLWSSHLRWSDKYLPPVPGVLYFSHLTEQAPPRRDL